MALMPLVLSVFIIGILLGAGLQLLGPKTEQLRVKTTLTQLDRASRSVIAWSRNNGRLPTATEFVQASGIQDDSYGNALVYVYAGSLANAAAGGVCGRETTGLSLDGVSDAAFAIISGGGNFTIDAIPNTTGGHAGDLTTSPLDFTQGISLHELQTRVGCTNNMAGRLVVLNNELPKGCNGDLYTAELFADGGVPPYAWTGTSVPSWLSLTPTSESCGLDGTPSSSGTYVFTVRLTDTTGTETDRHFSIVVSDCSAGP